MEVHQINSWLDPKPVSREPSDEKLKKKSSPRQKSIGVERTTNTLDKSTNGENIKSTESLEPTSSAGTSPRKSSSKSKHHSTKRKTKAPHHGTSEEGYQIQVICHPVIKPFAPFVPETLIPSQHLQEFLLTKCTSSLPSVPRLANFDFASSSSNNKRVPLHVAHPLVVINGEASARQNVAIFMSMNERVCSHQLKEIGANFTK